MTKDGTKRGRPKTRPANNPQLSKESLLSLAEVKDQGILVLFRNISRFDYDRMHAWAESFPNSKVEHVMHGIFVVAIDAGVEGEAA